MTAALTGQQALKFLGVNLRQDRLNMADEEMAKAINADLHTQPGVIILRMGRSLQFASALSDSVVRTLARMAASNRRYQVAGRSLYRNQVRILNGELSSNMITTLVPFRPLHDTSTWMFMADDALMRKDDGTNTYQWGITAPGNVTTAAGGGTGLTGSYSIRITYARVVDGAVAAESNPSDAGSPVVLANQDLAITGIPASTDPQVTHIRIYRSNSSGALHFFDQQIANGTTSATSSQADSALADEVEVDNDVPPEASWAVEHQNHLFLLRDAENPHYAWYSKRFRPEAVPPDNFLEIGNPEDPLQCGVSTAGLLGVFSRLTKYRVLGNVTSGFVPLECVSHRGTLSPLTCIPTSKGTLFTARDGMFTTDFTGEDQPFGDAILPLFFNQSVNGIDPINWDVASVMCTSFYKNKVYFAYPSGRNLFADTVAVFSLDTKRWYFYQYPTAIRSFSAEEDLDHLVAGSIDGLVYILEDGLSDEGTSISLDVETKDYAGTPPMPQLLKFFHYLKVDADMGAESLNVDFYVDDVLRHSMTVTGVRTKRLLPLPEGVMGYQWRARLRYSGTIPVKIYGISALWLPLAMA